MPVFSTNIRLAPSVDFSSGGMPFLCHAPTPGFALVGLVVRCGMWIDQIAPIFAEILDDGTLGVELHGATFGGYGGVMREVHCLPGHIVTGLQTRSGSFVDAVRLHQTRWDGSALVGEPSWTPWCGGMGGVERPERLAEPYGAAVAVGIAGRAGAYLDNLTVLTAELVKVTGTVMGAKTTRTAKAAIG